MIHEDMCLEIIVFMHAMSADDTPDLPLLGEHDILDDT